MESTIKQTIMKHTPKYATYSALKKEKKFVRVNESQDNNNNPDDKTMYYCDVNF